MAKRRRRRGWYWREGSSGLPYWEGRGSSRLPCRGSRGSSGLPGLVTRGSWRLARNQDGAWGPSLALLARGLLRGRQLFVKSSSIWNRTTPFSGRIPAESDSQSQLYTSYIFTQCLLTSRRLPSGALVGVGYRGVECHLFINCSATGISI